MLKNKIKAGIIFGLITFSLFGAINMVGVVGVAPSTTTVSGYVKDSVTRAGIYKARVVLYGWDFYIDMPVKVVIGSKYTDESGHYSFTGVTAKGPYQLLVTKTGYSTYQGAYRSPVYLVSRYVTLRVTGTVLESETIDNILAPIAESPLTLDITPEGMAAYNYVITIASVKIKIQDYTGTVIKTVTCSSTTGAYDTGSFSIKKGNVKITAYTEPGYYVSKYITKSVTTSTTLTGQNIVLERNQGTKKVYGDEGQGDNLYGFQIRPHQYYGNFIFDIMSVHAPTMVYNPFNSESSNYWISTSFLAQAPVKPWYLLYDYLVQKARISLYVFNEWTDDESFITLSAINYKTNEYGSNSKFDVKFTGGVGYKYGNQVFGGDLSCSAALQVTYTPANNIQVIRNTNYEDLADGRLLGYIDLDYSNNYNLNKELNVNWRVQLNNLNFKTLKQCGAHLMFKIKYEFSLTYHNFFGWHYNYLYNTLTFEQTIGDDALTYPVWVLDQPYDSSGSTWPIDFLSAGSQSGHDYWMNLLAGEASILPI
ncbi:MAG: carboxypeptidase-like regulatory domain-containing protein [Candidatus Hermodarchaeota archaeon]